MVSFTLRYPPVPGTATTDGPAAGTQRDAPAAGWDADGTAGRRATASPGTRPAGDGPAEAERDAGRAPGTAHGDEGAGSARWTS